MSDRDLHGQHLTALDELLDALDFKEIDDDNFHGIGVQRSFTHIFGGQLIAQALAGACRTVNDKAPLSMHAAFVSAGNTNEPVDISVTRVRDGRSVSTRQVSVTQHGRTLLTATCSFTSDWAEATHGDPPPPMSAPDDTPTLDHWLHRAAKASRPMAVSFIDHPPPVEIRFDEQLNFLGGPAAEGSRSQWMRLPRSVGDDRVLNAILLAFASDYFLLDMIARAHPATDPFHVVGGASLDHSLWFHQPVRFDQWHLYTLIPQAIAGERGLVRGLIHDTDGVLVASVMQEGLIRAPREATRR